MPLPVQVFNLQVTSRGRRPQRALPHRCPRPPTPVAAGPGPGPRAASPPRRPAASRRGPAVGPAARPGANALSLRPQAGCVSGSGGAESQDRMRGSPARGSASSSVTDLCRAPHSSRSDLFLPGTAGDFSLSASLSACSLLHEVPSRTGGPGASERGRGARPHPPAEPAGAGRAPQDTVPPLPGALRPRCRALLEARRGSVRTVAAAVKGPQGQTPPPPAPLPRWRGRQGSRSAAAGLARGGAGHGLGKGQGRPAPPDWVPDRILLGTWHRRQSPTQGTVRVSCPSWSVRFECQMPSCVAGGRGAHADRCGPPGGPAECVRCQLRGGEPYSGKEPCLRS